METKTKASIPVIADSSAMVSLVSPTDSNHKRAVNRKLVLEKLQATVIIPSDVFSETINILGKKFSHELALEAAEVMIHSPLFLVVDSLTAYSVALEKFKTTPGSVSFTDCVVLATADQYNTRQIFGFEEYFSKQGYQLPGEME